MVLKACITPGCRGYAVHGPRCAEHTRFRAAAKNRRRANAPGDGAARRERDRLRIVGSARCAHCGARLPSNMIEVDHRVALADGGRDVDGNLQHLCRPCHIAKTTREGRERA